MKLDDYDFARLPSEVIDFKDDVRQLLNFGKAQFQVVATAPTFAGRAGEVTLLRNGTDGRLYVYMGTSWNLAVSWTADAG